MPASPRAAHRPSRRVAVVQAAIGLAAERPFEDVTVSDIADRAGMTPAAIYYHFPSKEDVLLEGLRSFGDEIVVESRGRLEGATSLAALAALPAEMLTWLDGRRAAATVFFVASSGLNLAVEAWRREFRSELVAGVAEALRGLRPGLSAAKAGVIAAAYLSLFENAARTWLSRDDVYRRLGVRRLRAETTSTAIRILGA